LADVRFVSQADIAGSLLTSSHLPVGLECPLSAKNQHSAISFDRLVAGSNDDTTSMEKTR
jgi:hypothetical protein